jgi:Ser/Thr protein kinase RdoA (MazF antagonist)
MEDSRPSSVAPHGARGDLVCHTDLCLENVVVRDGRAATFIDFDQARPASPLFDIADARATTPGSRRCGQMATNE